MSNFQVGMGFVAHHEREGRGIGNGMDGSIVREFHHREDFGPFGRLILDKDPKEGFEFLVDLL